MASNFSAEFLFPADESAWRIGDADRADALEKLGQAVSTGYIALDEFEQRADAVISATTRGELANVFQDLPPAAFDPETATKDSAPAVNETQPGTLINPYALFSGLDYDAAVYHYQRGKKQKRQFIVGLTLLVFVLLIMASVEEALVYCLLVPFISYTLMRMTQFGPAAWWMDNPEKELRKQQSMERRALLEQQQQQLELLKIQRQKERAELQIDVQRKVKGFLSQLSPDANRNQRRF